MTYIPDHALNAGIWNEDSAAARKWLDEYAGGRFKLQGSAREPGSWLGDVELPGLAAWVERVGIYTFHVLYSD
jgi:hypothetical protein